MPTINMVGQPCPLPVINAKKALKDAAPGQVVVVVVDNEIATQNLTKMAHGLGHKAKVASNLDGYLEVTITAGEKNLTPAEGGLVIAISQNTMGQGEEILGKNLLKAFIFSLTELDPLPEYLLFFNSGAFVTTQGSDSLLDLQTLSDRGVVIGTCGACLDFYHLKDRLKVGAVTNMYAIASTMGQAKKLINI
jgi:selenium metabolism protein YedF